MAHETWLPVSLGLIKFLTENRAYGQDTVVSVYEKVEAAVGKSHIKKEQQLHSVML